MQLSVAHIFFNTLPCQGHSIHQDQHTFVQNFHVSGNRREFPVHCSTHPVHPSSYATCYMTHGSLRSYTGEIQAFSLNLFLMEQDIFFFHKNMYSKTFFTYDLIYGSTYQNIISKHVFKSEVSDSHRLLTYIRKRTIAHLLHNIYH